MWHALVALILALALPRAASADVTLVATTKYNEHFSSGSRVAGEVLVGLWLGELRDKVSLDSVHLLLPSRPSDAKACVSVNTRDGEYGGQGIYNVPQGGPDQGVVHITSSYESDLANYREADLGVRAELKPDCSPATPGLFLPAVAGGSPATLVALINGQRAVRVAAELRSLRDGPSVATGVCTRLGKGRSTAFDTICRIQLRGTPAGEYVLTVTRLTRAGDETPDSFRVSLDPAGQ